jgi:hypothetical protein
VQWRFWVRFCETEESSLSGAWAQLRSSSCLATEHRGHKCGSVDGECRFWRFWILLAILDKGLLLRFSKFSDCLILELCMGLRHFRFVCHVICSIELNMMWT